MKIIDKSFLSNDKKTNIKYKIYIPEKEINGVIQLIHGLTEYMKNYEEVAEYFCENNFLAVIHDQLGHGLSVSKREELGYYRRSDSVDILIDDINTLMNIIKNDYLERPYFLLGHSFGSFLSRIFASKYGNKINGLILTGTGNMDVKHIKHNLNKIRAISIIKKGNYRSKLIQEKTFNSYCSRIENPKTKFDWVCNDEKRIEEYLNDPLNNFNYTLNGYSTLLHSIIKMQDENTYKATPKNLPILLMCGREDPVGDYSNCVKNVYDIYKKYELNDVELKIYNGLRHNLFWEDRKKEVIEDCLSWMKDRI